MINGFACRSSESSCPALIDKYKDLGKELDGDLNLPNGFKVHIEPATKDTDE
jgi:hypothetical protein